MSAADLDPLTYAQSLIDAGVPVVICRPNPRWRSDGSTPGEPELCHPSGWQSIAATACDLSGFHLGVDVLAMVAGHGVDAVDVDSKAGGSVENLPPFRRFGRHRTPSGGHHDLVRSTGIGQMSPLDIHGRHVGDFCGGTTGGGGRRLVYLPGSTRPKYPDAGYEIEEALDLGTLMESDPDDDLIAALLGAGGSFNGQAGKPAAAKAELEAFRSAHAAAPERPCHYGRKAIEGLLTESCSAIPGDAAKGRHGWTVRSVTRVVELIRAGCCWGGDLDVIEDRLSEIKPEGGTIFDSVLSWALNNASGTTACGLHNPPQTANDDPGEPEDPEALPGLLRQLTDTLRSYQDLPDIGHLLVVLAVAASNALDTDPCWLLLVAPASSGKTETVRLLDGVTSERMDEVTCAGLLGWVKRGKMFHPGGALIALDKRGIITIGDLSVLLSSSDRGGRDQVFSMLRRIYDGHAERGIATPAGAAPGARLAWDGRATMVAACTPAIDGYSAHADALGPRWVYFRMDERDTAAKRRAATRARHGALPALRASARALAGRIVAAASVRMTGIEVPDRVAEDIEDAVLVTCWGRASVPRNGYGKREIDGMPEIEDPPRLVIQLHGLARGLLALGLTPGEVSDLCRRVALDSMPASRRAVLDVLSRGEQNLNTARVARWGDLHRHVARRTLEELEAIGVVEGHRVGPEPGEYEDDTRRCAWELAGADGGLIADVLQAHRKGRGRWHEK